uniref:Reverse transcriptase domain-containing protein n=1 Tax=Tanacetum cinerariifolium TaxID=118510 RepID=A0A6L2KBR8_TANCI|nr:reverse transcriptase domain-containing protein [Tanacetum cinerariifolium]
MADQRTMAELLRAPTEGYAEAIMAPLILAEQFELKHSLINMRTSNQFFGLEKDNPHDHIRWFNKITSTIKYKDVTNSAIKLMLFPFSLAGAACRWLEKEPSRSILTWDDLVSKFINEFFPPSRTTNLYDQDSLNYAAGGNLLERRTQDVLTIIENKSKDPLHPNIPYPLRMHKQKQQEKDEVEIHKFWQMFKQFHINITLADALILIPKYQKMLKALLSNKEKLIELENTPLNENCSAVILKKLPEKLGDPRKFLILCGFSELKCKASADLGASINLMPLFIWKKLGLLELISTRMTLELDNQAICTPAGIARDVFVLVGKFTFPADFVIVDYESDPRVPFILGRPFLRISRALIDIHGEEMILHDGDERLTLNMRHDTSSYSNQPQKESVNMINIYDDSNEDFLEKMFVTNHQSGSPTFSSHPKLTSPEVKDDIFDPEGGNVLSEKLLDLDSTKDLHPPHHFNIESDLKEIKYLLNHDPIKEMDSILEDTIDQSNLDDLNDILVDTMLEMFTEEHALDYSSPLLYDEYDDDFFEIESKTKYVYDDPFDFKGEKIKEFKLLIDELDLPSDFLPSSEYDSFLSEDFSKVDALPSTNNEDKVFTPGILIQENLFKVITCVALDKKLTISHASLIPEDFDPSLYELPVFKEFPKSKTLLLFSSENEEKVFKPGILTSKEVHSSLILELSHQGYKVFKINQILKSLMEIFLFSREEYIHILDVLCLYFYPP